MAYELAVMGGIGDVAPSGAWPTVPASWVAPPAPAPAAVTYDAAAMVAVGLVCLALGAGAVYAYEKGYL